MVKCVDVLLFSKSSPAVVRQQYVMQLTLCMFTSEQS